MPDIKVMMLDKVGENLVTRYFEMLNKNSEGNQRANIYADTHKVVFKKVQQKQEPVLTNQEDSKGKQIQEIPQDEEFDSLDISMA